MGRQVQLNLHGVMQQPDHFDQAVIDHSIKQDMSWFLDLDLRGPGVLAGIEQVVAAKARCDVVTLLAANVLGVAGEIV